ncbi:glyoxalase [Paraburkholderia sp. CNPSo 3157]|uniref:Glyoxalase n=1 Tax=Paraburkholderia franconis TaxID=2654983 RepID=A0A7X1NJ06_9BURK|nr:glyoxalase [Paraburkholderia franconis]
MTDFPAEISSLGYVVLGVKDFDAWTVFARDILGFQVCEREDDQSLALRMDERLQRVVLEKNDADDLLEAGWEFDTEEQLTRYVEQLRAYGTRVEQASAEECRRRSVETLYCCDDPNGFRHGFYYGPWIALMSDGFRSTVMRGAGFETGVLGLGHIVTRSADAKKTIEFYRSGLGLKISDYIRADVIPGKTFDVTFMHTASGRHHSLATGELPGEKLLGHLMVQVKDMNDVGLAYDRCLAAGLPIVMHLGHHPNDQMFSFYVRSPSGFAIEYGHGGIVIDDATWKVTTYSRLSDWGHQRGEPPRG